MKRSVRTHHQHEHAPRGPNKERNITGGDEKEVKTTTTTHHQHAPRGPNKERNITGGDEKEVKTKTTTTTMATSRRRNDMLDSVATGTASSDLGTAVLNLFMGIAFASFAFAQANDPDPFFWYMLAYFIGSICCFYVMQTSLNTIPRLSQEIVPLKFLLLVIPIGLIGKEMDDVMVALRHMNSNSSFSNDNNIIDVVKGLVEHEPVRNCLGMLLLIMWVLASLPYASNGPISVDPFRAVKDIVSPKTKSSSDSSSSTWSAAAAASVPENERPTTASTSTSTTTTSRAGAIKHIHQSESQTVGESTGENLTMQASSLMFRKGKKEINTKNNTNLATSVLPPPTSPLLPLSDDEGIPLVRFEVCSVPTILAAFTLLAATLWASAVVSGDVTVGDHCKGILF